MPDSTFVGRFRDDRGQVELELKDDGTLSYHGIWYGYEYTMIAGTWRQRDGYAQLNGVGSMHSDTRGFSDRAFEATFSQRDDGSVMSDNDAPGWSLLADRKPLLPVPRDKPRLIDR